MTVWPKVMIVMMVVVVLVMVVMAEVKNDMWCYEETELAIPGLLYDGSRPAYQAA